MPQRSNNFQRLVHTIKSHLADGGAHVEESVLVVDPDTGRHREVDVWITQTIAGESVHVAVECTDSKRPADVSWVNEMDSKHRSLPTNLLLLVARNGFSAQAIKKADSLNIQTASLEDLPEQVARMVVGRAGHLYSHQAAVRAFEVAVRIEEGRDSRWTVLRPGHLVMALLPEQRQALLLSVAELGSHACSSNEFRDDLMSKADPDAGFRSFVTEAMPRYELVLFDDDARHTAIGRITEIRVSGAFDGALEVAVLTHGQLAGAATSWGEVSMFGQSMLVVITETSPGDVKMSIVDRPAGRLSAVDEGPAAPAGGSG